MLLFCRLAGPNQPKAGLDTVNYTNVATLKATMEARFNPKVLLHRLGLYIFSIYICVSCCLETILRWISFWDIVHPSVATSFSRI